MLSNRSTSLSSGTCHEALLSNNSANGSTYLKGKWTDEGELRAEVAMIASLSVVAPKTGSEDVCAMYAFPAPPAGPGQDHTGAITELRATSVA